MIRKQELNMRNTITLITLGYFVIALFTSCSSDIDRSKHIEWTKKNQKEAWRIHNERNTKKYDAREEEMKKRYGW